MSRIRYLKPDFFKDEDLATLPFEVRLFFAGLWVIADKAGRLEDRPKRLKIEIFPYEDIDIEKCLVQLAKPKTSSGNPYILRYSIEGEHFIQILNWDKHQRPHHTEKESKIPPCPTEKNWHKGMGMGMGKGMGMGSVHQGTSTLKNGELTVKKVKIDINSDWYKELQKEFLSLDVADELNRFHKWEKDNSRKDHKRAFKNWLLMSEKWKKEKGQNGRNQEHVETDRSEKYRKITKVVVVPDVQ
jgi:hypothetical protein